MADEELAVNGKLLKELKLSELKEACKQRDISYTGSKAVLQKRLSAVSIVLYLSNKKYSSILGTPQVIGE